MGAVVHAHPPTATGFAVAGISLDDYPMIETVIATGSIPLTPYSTPSTNEVPEAIAPYLAEHDEEGCIVLADFLSTKTPAVALKENEGYTAIYYGAKYITADIVREMARFAGCHIYEETGHVFTVNNNFLSLHASHSGEVNIKLPEKHTAYELYEQKNYSENSDVFTFKVKKGDTKTFRLNVQSNIIKKEDM